MGQACLILLFAGAGLVYGAPVSIIGICLGKGSQKWFGALGLLLNLAVFPLGFMMMEFVALLMNLTIED